MIEQLYLNSIIRKRMKTKFHWKIIVAFLITPILSLALFTVIYKKMLSSDEPVPTGVFVFAGIFGVIGIWSFLVMLLRAKRIELSEKSIIIRRLFLPMKWEYSPLEIISYSIMRRRENPFYQYKILQFRTRDNKLHSVVSYEFREFQKIQSWIQACKPKKEKIGISNFLFKEYGLPFLIALIIVTVMLTQIN